MKTVLKIALGCCMVFVPVLTSCSVEDGLVGEMGLQGIPGEQGIAGEKGQDGVDGRDGTNGEDGANGQDGNLTVITSDWIDYVDAEAQVFFDPFYLQFGASFEYVAPILDQGLLDEALIMVFAKFNKPFYPDFVEDGEFWDTTGNPEIMDDLYGNVVPFPYTQNLSGGPEGATRSDIWSFSLKLSSIRITYSQSYTNFEALVDADFLPDPFGAEELSDEVLRDILFMGNRNGVPLKFRYVIIPATATGKGAARDYTKMTYVELMAYLGLRE